MFPPITLAPLFPSSELSSSSKGANFQPGLSKLSHGSCITTPNSKQTLTKLTHQEWFAKKLFHFRFHRFQPAISKERMDMDRYKKDDEGCDAMHKFGMTIYALVICTQVGQPWMTYLASNTDISKASLVVFEDAHSLHSLAVARTQYHQHVHTLFGMSRYPTILQFCYIYCNPDRAAFAPLHPIFVDKAVKMSRISPELQA